MQDQYSRTQLLLGAEAMEKLHHARVAVFGIGGVGALDLIDDDKVCLTNLNRQIIATRSTVGQYKAVSYTHLDVYKRQELQALFTAWLCRKRAAAFAM